MLLLVPQVSGCFHYVPASRTTLASGAEVSLAITDRGRVALSEPVGPGIRRLDGRVVENRDTSLVLALTSVRFIDLDIAMQRGGEQIEVAHDIIGEVRERRLSRSRTWVAVGLAAAGTVALFLITLRGFGGSDDNGRPGNGGGEQT